MYDMADICADCGETWGLHSGSNCSRPHLGKFILLPSHAPHAQGYATSTLSNNLPFIRLYAIDYGNHGCATWSDNASTAQGYLSNLKAYAPHAVWLVAEYDADPNSWRVLHGNKQAFFDHVLHLIDDPNRHLHLKTENLQPGADVRSLLINGGSVLALYVSAGWTIAMSLRSMLDLANPFLLCLSRYTTAPRLTLKQHGKPCEIYRKDRDEIPNHLCMAGRLQCHHEP